MLTDSTLGHREVSAASVLTFFVLATMFVLVAEFWIVFVIQQCLGV